MTTCWQEQKVGWQIVISEPIFLFPLKSFGRMGFKKHFSFCLLSAMEMYGPYGAMSIPPTAYSAVCRLRGCKSVADGRDRCPVTFLCSSDGCTSAHISARLSADISMPSGTSFKQNEELGSEINQSWNFILKKKNRRQEKALVLSSILYDQSLLFVWADDRNPHTSLWVSENCI